ncbi:MAG: acyltransferase family protein [Oscillospiraceae bacterium]|nr:acyltransferase family protein [Oscillospiraceae bacterium]
MVMQKQRIGYLDAVKGLGILLVVFAHVNYTPPLLVYAYSFHMPLFFLLSGMLFDSSRYNKFSAFVVHKAKTLLCPYVLFSVLTMLCSSVVDIAGGVFSWQDILEGLWQIVLSRGSQTIAHAAMWFLTCLFVVEATYFFLVKLNKIWIASISVLLTVLGWVMESGILPLGHAPFPWSLDSAFFCMGFFALGNLFANRIKKTVDAVKESKFTVLICLAVMIVCLAVQLPVAFLNGKVSIGSKILGNGFFLYITGVFGTACFLAVGVLLEKSRFLRYCGRNSLYILSIHWIAFLVVQFLSGKISVLTYDREDLLQTLLPFALVLLISLAGTKVYVWIKTLLTDRRVKKPV